MSVEQNISRKTRGGGVDCAYSTYPLSSSSSPSQVSKGEAGSIAQAQASFLACAPVSLCSSHTCIPSDVSSSPGIDFSKVPITTNTFRSRNKTSKCFCSLTGPVPVPESVIDIDISD